MYSGDVGDLFDGRGVFTLLPKVQLHVSALDNSHLQVVHESLKKQLYKIQYGLCTVGMWEMWWARDLVRVMEAGGGGTWGNCYYDHRILLILSHNIVTKPPPRYPISVTLCVCEE